MNRFKLLRSLSLVLIAGFSLLFSCSDDDSVTPFVPGQEGFFIVNEGGFGNGNASLSFFDRESGQMQNDVFFNANRAILGDAEAQLGDQAQSMTIIGDRGYIVVQNSNAIKIIDIDDFTLIETIDADDGIESPRYLLAVDDNKAYISDWGTTGDVGTVKVLDLATNQVTRTIPIGFGTNRMIMVNESVYVTNQGGRNKQTFEFTKDNKVSVINTQTDEVAAEITVGDNPSTIELDDEGNLWVAGPGNVVFNEDWSVNLDETTAGFISKIAPDNTVIFTAQLPEKNSGPKNTAISLDGNVLYFNYLGDIYTLDTDIAEGESLEISQFIDKDFNGFSVDPSTGEFIGAEAPNFISAGIVHVYSVTGELQNQYETGIGPNGATFK